MMIYILSLLSDCLFLPVGNLRDKEKNVFKQRPQTMIQSSTQ